MPKMEILNYVRILKIKSSQFVLSLLHLVYQVKNKKKDDIINPTLITLKPFYRPHEKKGRKKKPETPPQVSDFSLADLFNQSWELQNGGYQD